ncbi:MAG TPA: MFS transporter [Ramlibacter sp.]|uniref:MFS transporter n=1 Tax=Ramlibacter sp. TaxID=1917967 RepID=UPI002C323AFD|nr:MFS transporter [Ramlibacter sp.]HVZ46032.1 MFS transporter [Ramlibacter sp.]
MPRGNDGKQVPPASDGRWLARLELSDDNLLRDRTYRRLWLSILISAFGAQITMLALPLTAAVMLHATAEQMGVLTAMEIVPFVLLSLPSGVWLDRVRKLPVYIAGEGSVALALTTVPIAWYFGWLGMPYLYGVAFFIGCVFTTAGSAAQIVLTQVVPRERLVEAHAKNALAGSAAEVAGPGVAGALIRLVGAPFALLADAVLLAFSVAILRGLKIEEPPHALIRDAFWPALRDGMRFVASVRLLVVLAILVGCWQLFHQMAMVVQILVATRELGLNERQVGLCYIGLGVGTVFGSALGHAISRRIGVGRCLLAGFALCGVGWLQLAFAPKTSWGIASFVFMLVCFGGGAVMIFINFLALRQAVTPQPLLGRMTSTMRWLILIPAAPGALAGGWLGEHVGLRWALGLGGVGALMLAGAGYAFTQLRTLRELPRDAHDFPMDATRAIA